MDDLQVNQELLSLKEEIKKEIREEFKTEIAFIKNESTELKNSFQKQFDYLNRQIDAVDELVSFIRQELERDHYLLYWSVLAKEYWSEDFIMRYSKQLGWNNISEYQKLSWEFICKFYKKIDIAGLIKNDRISQEIKNKIKNLEIFK